MNQSGNRNSLLGWVKSLKKNTLSSDSIDEVHDGLAPVEPKSPSRSSFQSSVTQPMGFSVSPTKEQASPHSFNSGGTRLSSTPAAPEFLRPLLSHKSRSTNNVNQPNSLSQTLSNQDISGELRQQRDSFLQNNPLIDENSKYFGVPLADAINQASAKISIMGPVASTDGDDNVAHYGRIPVVVAKCGVYLKKNGLNVEGIFRVGGSSKRIKELQMIFNTPPDFGKKLNWEGYTVHDAASLLRRYLNALPEPLIPLELYEEFRDPLRTRQRIIKYLKYKAENPQNPPVQTPTPSAPESINGVSSEPVQVQPDVIVTSPSATSHLESAAAGPQEVSAPTDDAKLPEKKPKSYKNLTRDVYGAINDYKVLLDELPNFSKQLLFYILDLLAMVQNLSKENLMSSRNLAAIFQPSILSHPDHDMDPEEYALSQSVVEFLIHYSYKLLPNNETKSSDSKTASVSHSPSHSVNKQVEPAPEAKPPTRRQHSQSLSSPNNELEFIGYRLTGDSYRSVAFSDTEHDFLSVSSVDEGQEAH